MIELFASMPLPPINETTSVNWVRAMVEIVRMYKPPELYGRGIVIPGGGKYLPSAWVAVRALRHFGCKLPIQLWHLGENELPKGIGPAFEKFDVELMNAHEDPAASLHKRLNGWELKAFALMRCPWRDVILLDADNIPLMDITQLFDEELYKNRGSIFWPDYGRWSPGHKIWRLAGIEYRDESEFETGQIVVDRARCWHELALSEWFNFESEFWYSYIHGDKDTFRLAWRALGTEYGMVAHQPPPGIFFHRSPSGRPAFVHQTKWEVDPTLNNTHKRVPAVCHEFIAEFAAELAVLGHYK